MAQAISRRLTTFASILRCGAGLFDASQEVTRAEWRSFVHSTQIQRIYPGIQGLGFARMLAPAEVEAHTRQIRAEGFPVYGIHPAGERAWYSSIIYLEPFDERNQRAFGYDMYAEPVRRAAMDAAMDSGSVSVSQHVRLVQETDRDIQQGFLMYMPVYRPGCPVQTVTERREAILGFVYSPFRVDDLMLGIFGPKVPGLSFAIYDAAVADGQHLLYTSTDETLPSGGCRSTIHLKPFDGAQWTLAFKADDDFMDRADRNLPLLVALVGVVIALLLFSIILVLAGRARRVQQLAERRTIELSESQKHWAEESERLRVTLRSIGDAVITTDVSGRIALMNRVAEELTGWPLAEAQGRPLEEVFRLVDEHTHQPCPNPVQQVLTSGQVVVLPADVLLVSRDGRQRVVGDSGAPIRDAGGSVIGVVMVFRDITESRRLEEHLQNASKLQAIGVLAGGIAHDFNNLLGAAFGLVELAQHHLNTKREVDAGRALDRALAAFDRATGITRQLLTFAKGGQPVRKVQNLAGLLEDAARFVLTGSDISLDLAMPLDLWPCEVDAVQIGQVVENLTLNARQAMPRGGTLTLTADNCESAPPPLRPGRYVRFVLRDTGCGIRPEHLGKVFDPFFTTKPAGRGLGLATAFSIINKHDGLITVESQVGQGSAFTVYLPAHGSTDALGGPEAERPELGGWRILVMEDEVGLCGLIQEFLTDIGYKVCAVADSESAIAAYRSALHEGMPFHLVLLDLTVPGGKGGQETLTELQALDPQVRALAASGYAEAPVMTNPAAFGFVGAIAKPFRIHQLAAFIKKHLPPLA